MSESVISVTQLKVNDETILGRIVEIVDSNDTEIVVDIANREAEPDYTDQYIFEPSDTILRY